MKRFTLILVFVLSVLSVFASPKQLKNFEDIMDAFKAGKEVRVVAEYGKCKLISNNEEKKAPNAIGGMKADVWEYFAPMSIGNPKAFVVFSQSKLINYGGYIYNYAKFKVSDDNKVKITAQYANGKTLDIEMNENFFGDINNGKNEGPIYFYAE
jgi:hypothetical protein